LVFSGGEALCRDDVFSLVRFAKAQGITTALATNGTLLSDSAAEAIRDSGIGTVAVSLDGATADVHNHLRRQAGSFEKALEGISRLKDKAVPFQINVTVTKHNAGSLQDVYELASRLGAAAMHLFMLVPVGCGRSLAQTEMLSAQQYEQTMVAIYQLQRRAKLALKVTCGPHYERVVRQQSLRKSAGQARHDKGQGTPQPADSGQGGPSRLSAGCLAGTGILFVAHQGDVFPCGYLPVKCGNVLETTLAEIWRTSRDLARLRDRAALEGKCGLCNFRNVCSGCRARAYAATGNYMAEEPFCAYVPSPRSSASRR
jgi:radical SAM protein with 4Fe4S-binding SPASM domain